MRHRLLLVVLLTPFLLLGQLPDFKPSTPLLGAILTNNTEAVKSLLAEGADPNEGRFFGSTGLVLAIVNGNQPIIREMLAKGADVNAADRHGSTPLMWAVGSESAGPAVVGDLLQRGADPNAQNQMGESALNWAMRRGDASMVERLKAAGASDARTVRQSVENALAVLQKSGPQFVKVSGCVSCHHQSLPQMAYSAARQRGFNLDSAVAEQQLKSVVAVLKSVKEPVEKGAISLPNPGISVSYTLLGLAAEGYAPDELTSAMILAISRTQLPNGSFAVYPGRPPLEASAFTSTALSIRALQVYGRDSEGKISKAQEWLKQTRPSSNEERTMRLLGLSWSNAGSTEIEAAANELLAQQRPDGGWAQLAGLESDAYATGQAMVALHEAKKLAGRDPAYQRGVAFLLRTQLTDGSWLVRTRSSPVQQIKDSGFPHGRHQWISAAGTSWASLALTLSQPVTAPPAASGGLF